MVVPLLFFEHKLRRSGEVLGLKAASNHSEEAKAHGLGRREAVEPDFKQRPADIACATSG